MTFGYNPFIDNFDFKGGGGGGGTVTSVSGTPNRITSTGGNTPQIDIDANYVGQTSLTTLGTITTGTWNATVIGVVYGGTGLNAAAQGDVLYGSAADTYSRLAKDTNATRYLSNTGASNNPAWAQVNLTNGVTGALPPANGGTGLTTYNTGDILYASAPNVLSTLPIGSASEVLTVTGGIPSWEPNAGGTDLHVARFIVHPTAPSANYTTIGAAIAAASAGDTIAIQSKATAYNEDFTLPTGINLVAYSADANTPTVTIKGKITATSAGVRSISGIRLETDGDNLLEITGSNAVTVNLINCFINCSDATGIDINNGNANVNAYHCKGDIGTTGIAIHAVTDCSMLSFEYCYFTNSGNSTTANSCASGEIRHWWTRIENPVSITGDAKYTGRWSRIECATLDTTALTLNTSETDNTSFYGMFSSGTATSIVITAGTLRIVGAYVSSSNTNAISGAGTIEHGSLSFRSTASGTNRISTTNQVTYAFREGKPPFEEITGTSHTAIPGGHYIANNAGLVTITLPSTFAVGDIVWVVGKGAGLWALDCPAGDVIHYGNQDTSSGGTLTATNRYDAIQVVGTVANSEWTCTGVSQGNLSVS